MHGQWAGRLDLGTNAADVSDRLSYSTITYEEGYANLEALKEWYSSRVGTRNEATTRKHLIDKLFFGCLGWQDDDVVFEDYTTNVGYTDYTFAIIRPALIVEAKKEGSYFEFPVGNYTELTLATIKRDSPLAKAAVEQVSNYCISKGVQFAVVTNGHQLIVFAASRDDGMAPDQGKAIIFDSLDAMGHRFLTLWNLLSRDSIAEGNLRLQLLGSIAAPLPPKPSRAINDYTAVKGRNPFQAELQAVSEYVLEDITRLREYEPQFLKECYCENGALAQYSLIGRTILKARYQSLFDKANPGPALQAITDNNARDFLSAGVSKRPILLIGDVGVGKTTFVKHLLGSESADHTIILYIDLGSSQSLSLDPRVSIVEDIRETLREDYELDIDADVFVRSVYHGELIRFGRSIQGRLKQTNPTRYAEREISFLEQRISQSERHLKASLENIVTSRHKSIVVVLDNCDQRNESTQELTFLIAQEMAENWPATVFVSLRPETYHISRRRGALTGYHSRAFSIAPPRTDEVIVKRLNYALRIARGEIAIGASSGFGQLTNLETMLQVFLGSLSRNVRLFECIENVSGGNIRFALDLIRTFFGSGHVNTRKIIEIERVGQSPYTIPIHEFLRALIYGDNVYYDPGSSPIANLFDLSAQDPREHFLLPLLLGVLNTSADEATEHGFVPANRAYSALEALGFTAAQIDFGATRAVRKKLIDTVARRLPEAGSLGTPSMRITSVGRYHFLRLARQFLYYDAVLVDTPIFDATVRSNISSASTISERLNRAEIFIDYLDNSFQQIVPEATNYFDWRTTAKDLWHNLAQVRQDAARAAAAREARDQHH